MKDYTIVRIYNKLTGVNFVTYFQGKLNRYEAFNKVIYNCLKNSTHKFLNEIAKLQGCYEEWEVFTRHCSSKDEARAVLEYEKKKYNCNYPHGLNNYRNNGRLEIEDIENFKTALHMAKNNKFNYWKNLNNQEQKQSLKQKTAHKNISNEVKDQYQIVVLKEQETNKHFAMKIPLTSNYLLDEDKIMTRFKNRVDNTKLSNIIPSLFPYENFSIVHNERFNGSKSESKDQLDFINDKYNCEFPFGFNLPKSNRLDHNDILDGLLEVKIEQPDSKLEVETEWNKDTQDSLFNKIASLFKW